MEIKQLGMFAEKIGKTKRDLALCRGRQYELKASIEGRTNYITPAEGWPGKNAEAREKAQRDAVHQDEPIQKMQGELDVAIQSEMVLTAILEEAEAGRRALEWEIRLRLVNALEGRRNSTEADPAESAFDDVADEVVLATAAVQAAGAVATETVNKMVAALPSQPKDDIDI